MEKGSLADIIRPSKFGALPESLAAVYIAQVLQGLAYLHEQGVVHRDIKGATSSPVTRCAAPCCPHLQPFQADRSLVGSDEHCEYLLVICWYKGERLCKGVQLPLYWRVVDLPARCMGAASFCLQASNKTMPWSLCTVSQGIMVFAARDRAW